MIRPELLACSVTREHRLRSGACCKPWRKVYVQVAHCTLTLVAKLPVGKQRGLIEPDSLWPHAMSMGRALW
jgi:hypothetical protein